MNFDDFTVVEFPPINQEFPAFVYVLFWLNGSREVPFYVGQTTRIWGRLDDYYWGMFSACTDFRVGEAVRHLTAKGYRVVLKYKATREPRRAERELIEHLSADLNKEGRKLLNVLPGFDYRTANESEQRLRVQRFIDDNTIAGSSK